MPVPGLSHVRHFNVLLGICRMWPLVWSTAPLCGLGLDLSAEQICDGHWLTRFRHLVNKVLETFGKKFVPQAPVMFQTRGSEIMLVKIPPATPDLFIHQTINEIEVDCLHRF